MKALEMSWYLPIFKHFAHILVFYGVKFFNSPPFLWLSRYCFVQILKRSYLGQIKLILTFNWRLSHHFISKQCWLHLNWHTKIIGISVHAYGVIKTTQVHALLLSASIAPFLFCVALRVERETNVTPLQHFINKH